MKTNQDKKQHADWPMPAHDDAAHGAFAGWSAPARAACGVLALATAAVSCLPGYPAGDIAQADAWGLLALAAFIIQGAALGLWYARLPRPQRRAQRLEPVLRGLAPFLVTCAISVTMILRLDFRVLPGLWMCGYGLVNLAVCPEHPRGMRLVGLYYVLCGPLCLLSPLPFRNPWPLGAVFFAGELWGAAVLHGGSRTASPAPAQGAA